VTVASPTSVQGAIAKHGVAAAVLAADGFARRRISVALERAGNVVIASEARAEELASGTSADLVVLAASGAVRVMVEEITSVTRRVPDARIVLLTKDLARRDVRRCIDAGADGVAAADDWDRTLVPTVQAVLAGQLAVPRSFRAQMVQVALSSREKQVLGLVVMGLTNAEIAKRLFLAESTVKSHLSSGFSKLGVHSRNEAAALILDPRTHLGPGILAVSGGLDQEHPNPAPKR
jgi:DNA-binding NarL/FixJ family response regulator